MLKQEKKQDEKYLAPDAQHRAGCAAKPQSRAQPLTTQAPVQPAVPLTANQTCVKSLATLKAYNAKSASKYNLEMGKLTRKTSQFISVKENLVPDANNLVMDAYHSRMDTLCYRIETTLGQAMIAQASS